MIRYPRLIPYVADNVAALRTVSVLLAPSLKEVTTRSFATIGDQGGGTWIWRTGNQSANLTADPLGGVWIAPSDASTGASGAWQREFTGSLDVTWWGAVGDTTAVASGTDCQPAFQAAVTYGAYLATTQGDRPGIVFHVPRGGYRTSAPIDLSGWPTTTCGYLWRGDGPESSVIYPDAFGRNLACFKCDHGDKDNKVRRSEFKDIRISGASNDDDPVGVYMPYIYSGTRWINFDIQQLHNSAVICFTADNWKWWGGDIQSCGGQYVEKTLGTCFWGGTADGTTVTAYTNTSGTTYTGAFTGMEGKKLYLQSGYTSGGDTRNVFMGTIETVPTDGSTCTIDTPLGDSSAASDGNKASFGYIRGSTASGNLARMECTADVWSSDDIGRLVYIRSGADGDGVLSSHSGLYTTITAVPDAATIDLADECYNALTDVEILVAPAIVLCRPESERVAGNITNDVQLIGLRNEQSRAAGYLIETVQNCWISHGKLHGRGITTNDFGMGGYLLVADSTAGRLVVADMFITPAGNGNLNGTGQILAVGGNTKLAIVNSTMASFPPDGFNVDWNVAPSASGDFCNLEWGVMWNGGRQNKYPILVGESTTLASISWAGNTDIEYRGSDHDLAIINQSGFMRSPSYYTFGPWDDVANGDKIIIDPVTLTGNLELLGDATADIGGKAWFKTTRDGAAAQVVECYDPLSATNFFVSSSTAATYNVAAEGTASSINVAMTTDNLIVVANRGLATQDGISIVITGAPR